MQVCLWNPRLCNIGCGNSGMEAMLWNLGCGTWLVEPRLWNLAYGSSCGT